MVGPQGWKIDLTWLDPQTEGLEIGERLVLKYEEPVTPSNRPGPKIVYS